MSRWFAAEHALLLVDRHPVPELDEHPDQPPLNPSRFREVPDGRGGEL
jgi:hypothetical protein